MEKIYIKNKNKKLNPPKITIFKNYLFPIRYSVS